MAGHGKDEAASKPVVSEDEMACWNIVVSRSAYSRVSLRGIFIIG
jgi:hypothetical protein